MKTIIDIRICYEIEGNEKSLKKADEIYKEWQAEFEKLFLGAKLNFVHIAKSNVKKDC